MPVSSVPRLIAEWEPQSGVLMAWPHARTDWAPILAEVETVYLQLAASISRFEKVLICCRDDEHREHLKEMLASRMSRPDRIAVEVVPYQDTWIRDYGPLSILRGNAVHLLKFAFNGWGRRFDATLDNLVTARLSQQQAFGETPLTVLDDWILEGGSIDTDGRGTLLATVSCLLAENRNPGHNRDSVERRLQHLLGAQRILWLEHGSLLGDDTDGHVDMLARFTGPSTICHVACDDEDDEHFTALRMMRDELRRFRQTNGKPYHLVPLPIPRAIYNKDGRRLPASHVNFLLLNRAVIMPIYDDPADAIALRALRECFPSRNVIPINARPLIEQSGSIHCATSQVAAGVSLGARSTIVQQRVTRP